MLTEKQSKAFDLITKASSGISKIEGYAGTGKSFLLSQAAESIQDRCIVLTPTNKSAQVLRNKGIKARTLHSVLYSPRSRLCASKKNGQIQYHKDTEGNDIIDQSGNKIPIVESEELDFDFVADREEFCDKTVIIDEASMLKEKELSDIESVFDRIVLIGDGMQLPPIGSKDIFRSIRTDIFLDEVHRVAKENPIINLATHIRTGGRNFKQFEDTSHLIITDKFNEQVSKNSHTYTSICYTNVLRQSINNKARKKLGYTSDKVEVGEPIISLVNIRDADRRMLAFNGEMFTASESRFAGSSLIDEGYILLQRESGNRIPFRCFKFWDEKFWKYYSSGEFEHDWVAKFRALPNKSELNMFDFAYCLTAHKAQGSEFNATIVWDQSQYIKGTSEEKTRWLYTAATRSKEKMIMVK